MFFKVQILTGEGLIRIVYEGLDEAEARHAHAIWGKGYNLMLCKEQWIVIDGRVDAASHRRYVGAPPKAMLGQETRAYLESIGIHAL